MSRKELHMSRVEPVSFGAFVLLVPSVGRNPRDERVVKPALRGVRRA